MSTVDGVKSSRSALAPARSLTVGDAPPPTPPSPPAKLHLDGFDDNHEPRLRIANALAAAERDRPNIRDRIASRPRTPYELTQRPIEPHKLKHADGSAPLDFAKIKRDVMSWLLGRDS